MTKRYLLFRGSTYYPAGGWKDLAGQFDRLRDVVKVTSEYAEDEPYDWWHVIDTSTGKMIAGCGDSYSFGRVSHDVGADVEERRAARKAASRRQLDQLKAWAASQKGKHQQEREADV